MIACRVSWKARRYHPFAGEIRMGAVAVDIDLKVIDQGSDDTTNAVSIRAFFGRTAGVETATRTQAASVIQTPYRIPEAPLSEDQILAYQVQIPEPLRFLEPRETETRRGKERRAGDSPS